MINKIIRITIIVLMLIAGVFCWKNNVNRYSSKEETTIQDTNEKLVSNDNKNKTENEEKTQDSKNDSPELKKDEEIKPVDKTIEKVETTTSPTEAKEIKPSNSTPKQEVKQDEQMQPAPIVEPKKQEIWESLGMTKDQYYNQPMYSWERVDFKTRAECEEHGDSYEPYLNGEVLYNCRDVTSPSGKYLGTMFDVEKLN